MLDVEGNWSEIAPAGDAVGQVVWPVGLAVDAAGTLYVADGEGDGRIQRRDAQGNWSVIATYGSDMGQVAGPTGLAVDVHGNLYVADSRNDRVQRYTPGP
jgi:DNA-binding beta-propeller fold protein YncE